MLLVLMICLVGNTKSYQPDPSTVEDWPDPTFRLVDVDTNFLITLGVRAKRQMSLVRDLLESLITNKLYQILPLQLGKNIEIRTKIGIPFFGILRDLLQELLGI